MTSAALSDHPIEDVLGAELAHGDALIGTVGPVLRHLLNNEDHSLFSDEIVARVRGMLADLARQLLDELAIARGAGDQRDHPAATIAALAAGLMAEPAVLAHIHALALEWQLTERIELRLSLDPVLSPLLQTMIAAADGSAAASAMALLAAQARFAQSQRRMQLPLTELPADLLHAALLVVRETNDMIAADPQHVAAAEAAIRARYAENRTRLALLARLIMGLGGEAASALAISHAGVPLFLSGLALASGQDRDTAVLATTEGQFARLALGLRASGLSADGVTAQFAALHPEVTLPPGFEGFAADHAAELLARSAAVARR